MRVGLVRRSEWVSKKLGSSPMLATHCQPRRAYLLRRDRPIPTATAAEEELPQLLIGGSDITVDRLSGLLRHLEPDRLAGLLLADGRPINRVTMRSNVLYPQADDITSHPRSSLSMASRPPASTNSKGFSDSLSSPTTGRGRQSWLRRRFR